MSNFERCRTVERSLPGGRRLVQPLDAAAASLLAGSAPLVWDLLLQFRDIESIVEVLCERFDDSPQIIGAGVSAAIEMMLAEQLIEAVSHQ